MNWLAGGLTAVNVSTVCGLVFGMLGHGLTPRSALLSLLIGGAAAVFAYRGTYAPPKSRRTEAIAEPPKRLSKRAQRRLKLPPEIDQPPPQRQYRRIWFWLMAACFALFALRSFCWLLYIEGAKLKIQSPNNLGDLSLHLTYIRTFANGVALWPENPIHVFSNLRYPAGTDLFNALLLCTGVDVIHGLVWVGLLGSLATCYALHRWSGSFGIAGFLFNGGLAAYEFFTSFKFLDYEGDKTIGWKNIPLAMFVTQRGLLYAIPAGLLLLCHWRTTFGASRNDNSTDAEPKRLIPFWLELSLYATMPLFHVHTFLALSILLAWWLFLGTADARRRSATLLATAFIPATWFMWVITDHFHARSILDWSPGWVQSSGEFAHPLAESAETASGLVGTVSHFLYFWIINFGVTLPLIISLVAVLIIRAFKGKAEQSVARLPVLVLVVAAIAVVLAVATTFVHSAVGYAVLGVVAVAAVAGFGLVRDWKQTLPVDVPSAFVMPAVTVFLFACFVKTAPWEWDNMKLIIWAYLIVLPFLWSELLASCPWPVRAGTCAVMFASGFISIIGGLASPGFDVADRVEVDNVDAAVRKLPVEARFAAYPIYNHPLLLNGRKLVLGYPGHLWTQGFDYGEIETKLTALMQGAGDWQATARELHVRYLFWGAQEKTNYRNSKKPWEKSFVPVASGTWGTIYDLENAAAGAPAG
jgi:hypothetical protein